MVCLAAILAAPNINKEANMYNPICQLNHPKPGSIIAVNPIRNISDINKNKIPQISKQRGIYPVAARQGRVIKRVGTPPRKAGQPPSSESLVVGW